MNRRRLFKALAAVGLGALIPKTVVAESPADDGELRLHEHTLIGAVALPADPWRSPIVQEWVHQTLRDVRARCDRNGEHLVRHETAFLGMRQGYGTWVLRAWSAPIGGEG